MSPEEREKKRRWMMEYNRRRKASAAKATQLDLDALNAIYGTRRRPLSAIDMTRPPQSWQYISPEQAGILERRLA